MKKLTVIFSFCLTAVASALAQSSLRPEPQYQHWTRSWWQARLARQDAQIAKGGVYDVVFIGDSITQFFEEGAGRDVWKREFVDGRFKGLNLGISGDRTENVLWRFDHGQLDGYRAKVFAIMLGTNNAGHRNGEDEPPGDTIAGLAAVVSRILRAHPESKIILTSIFVRGTSARDYCRQRNEVVNAEIRKWADEKRIFWLDFNPQFVNADGTLKESIGFDGMHLHVGKNGYEVWVANLKPLLEKIIDGKATSPVPVNPPVTIVEASGETNLPRTARAEMSPNGLRRMAAKREAIGSGPRFYDAVLFGDSITHYWETTGKEVFRESFGDLATLNLGFAGDRTEHLLWYVRHGGLFEGYSTRRIMLMIGTNNIDDSAEDVAAGIRAIVAELRKRQPQAQIVLLPIFPKGPSADNPGRVKNEKTNALIRPLADGRSVVWCDFNAKFLGPDGALPQTLFGDYLHPTAAGYRLWADATTTLLHAK